MKENPNIFIIIIMGNVSARDHDYSHEHGSKDSKTVGLDSIKAQVVKVHVDGVARTKEDLVMLNLEPIFKVKHFEDLVLKAQDVRHRLEGLGCFSDVDVHIDTCENSKNSDYEVTFKVTEVKRIVGSVNTMVGNQEGSLMVGLKLPNLVCRGERFQVEYSHGTKKTSQFNMSLVKPLHMTHPGSVVTGSVFQQMGEFPWSGYKELNRGTMLDLAFLSAPQVAHNLQWECNWRNLTCLNRMSAFAVREQCGHTLKSSLKHILAVDRRDNPIFPAEGSLFKLSQEYAGLGLGGGDVGFFKNEVEAQANVPLLANNNLVLQGTFNCGHIKRMSNDKTMTIADRFFLGGPLNVRGFEMRGLGPASEGNSVGGLAYWAAGLHAYTPLPFLQRGSGSFSDLFRTHAFVNAGNLMSDFEFNRDKSLGRNVDEAVQNFRLSYGLGLALKLGGIARVELNYCVPIRAGRGDRPAPGLQFGVGVNFL